MHGELREVFTLLCQIIIPGCHIFENIYYNDGKYYGIYSQVVQLLWVMVLAGVAISSILGLKRKPCQK